MELRHISQLDDNEKNLVLAECKKLMTADVSAGAKQIAMGKSCYKYVRGEIFTESELKEIEDADKVPVQTAEGLTKIAAIIGQLDQAAKDGVIVGSGPEDAAPAELRELLLKEDIEVNSDLRRIELQIAQDVLVTGVPTFAFLEPFDPDDITKPGLTVQYASWDSVVTDGAWRDPMLRDCRRIHRIKQFSYPDLIERFVHLGGVTPEQLKQYEMIYARSSSREVLETDFLSARQGEATSPTGLVNVIETLQFVYMDFPVAVAQDGSTEVLPPMWTPQEIEAYQQANPGVQMSSKREKILWSAVWTYSGLLLDYGPHWFQEAKYPCVPFVPAFMDGKWMGIIEGCRAILKDLSYMMTEQLQGIRTINNNLWKAKRSAISDADEFERARKTAGSTVWVEDDANLDDVNPVSNVRENGAFTDGIAAGQDMLSRLTVERNFEGGAQASQESSKAIGARIQQGLSKIGFFLYGWHNMRRQLRSLVVKAMPACYPVEKIIRKVDPANGQIIEHQLNQPAEYDWNGEAVKLKNRLDAGDFDFMMTEADNSTTGKELQRTMYLEFMKNFGNLPPDQMALIATEYPAESVQRMGKKMQEAQAQAAQQPPAPPPTKISINLSSAELGSEQSIAIAQKAGALPPPPPLPQGPQEEQMEGAGSNPQEEIPEGAMPPEMQNQPEEGEE